MHHDYFDIVQSTPAARRTAFPPSVIRDNIGFVFSFARRYFHHLRDYPGRDEDFDDLIQEGCVGLLTAHRKFRDSFKVKFLTYASHWVRWYLLNYLYNKMQAIPLPRHLWWKRGIERVNVEMLSLSHELTRVSDACDEPLTLGDTLADAMSAAKLAEAEQRLEVDAILNRLAPAHRLLLIDRYGLDGTPPKTFREIAAGSRRTYQAVAQQHNGIIRAIRDDRWRRVRGRGRPRKDKTRR